jgi:GH15 family glucan-1,4-alpha-glucosidase
MRTQYDTGLLPYIRDTYTRDAIARLRAYLESQHTFDFAPLTSGLYPATPNKASEGGRYRYAWVRDNVHIAQALWRAGRETEALSAVHALVKYFEKHTERFEAIIEGRVDSHDPMQRPHVRFDGDTLEEVAEAWSHAQNDVHGLFLWLTGNMVHEGVLEFSPTLHRIISRTIQYLTTIHFYEDADSGAWEEGRAVRASSIGAVCAGLRAWHDVLHDYDHTRSHLAFELYQQGMQALNAILPYEVRGGENEREYDGALLVLVTPLGLFTGQKADQIVERVGTHLMGEWGIKRYLGDAFWGPEYDQLPENLRTADASADATFRARYAVTGKEAEWTIFDPLIARYFATRKRELEEYDSDMCTSARYLNRSLRALVRTPQGTLQLPELYYHKAGALVPNTILPLYWAQANLLLSLS